MTAGLARCDPPSRSLTSSDDDCLACQSSSSPTVSASTPNATSWGSSRRLRFSSAKPGKRARPMTWSHSSPACSSDGSRLITGPKNATPSGGSKWMIGVPTSLPVSDSASSSPAGSRRPSARHRGRRPAGRQPRLGQDRLHELTRAAPLAQRPLSAAVVGVRRRCRRWRAQACCSWSMASRPCSARARATTRSRRSPRCGRLRTPAGSGRRSRPAVDQPQRDEPPVDGEVALVLHHPQPLARHPAERTDRVEVEADVGTHPATVGQGRNLRLGPVPRRAASVPGPAPSRRPRDSRPVQQEPALLGRATEDVVEEPHRARGVGERRQAGGVECGQQETDRDADRLLDVVGTGRVWAAMDLKDRRSARARSRGTACPRRSRAGPAPRATPLTRAVGRTRAPLPRPLHAAVPSPRGR